MTADGSHEFSGTTAQALMNMLLAIEAEGHELHEVTVMWAEAFSEEPPSDMIHLRFDPDYGMLGTKVIVLG